MSWDTVKEAKLRELWGKGKTASQIAEIIGGVSRNAVIGKAHRLKLAAKVFSKSNKVKTQLKNDNGNNEQNPRRMSRKEKFKSILLDKNFEPENPKNLEELTDETCRFPIGHPNEDNFYFCGRKPEKDFPYCKLHVLYSFQPKNVKEDVITKEDEIPKFIEKKIKSA